MYLPVRLGSAGEQAFAEPLKEHREEESITRRYIICAK
jgi:hypothetical protein